MLEMAWPGLENDRMLRGMLLELSRASQLPYKAKIYKSKENLINLIIFHMFPYYPFLGPPPFNRPPSATLEKEVGGGGGGGKTFPPTNFDEMYTPLETK